jgi:hypothetical protein
VDAVVEGVFLSPFIFGSGDTIGEGGVTTLSVSLFSDDNGGAVAFTVPTVADVSVMVDRYQNAFTVKSKYSSEVVHEWCSTAKSSNEQLIRH